jgi:two-component system, OmpR family, phosphate regulon sensor histidine kinase PhoR
MKYSKKEPLIEVVVNRQEGGFFISIKDDGIGMAQSQLDRVFKRFITVNKSHSRKLGGAGLGLSLVDTIIKRHSGNISIESELDKGTQITFQFTT